ncbi:hypothetical protein EJK80_10345 [Corynebacterium phoceense]|uniref:Uncharacterized protein n=1 Tax=Corynebacterium phoceense TaxID=1686286 RepID=A0A540R588_9CORY|nr:hypothetical protein [Corynebacterium phoceense]TQE42903.1 hypothetical protein EJK80_10345 [Corynebacterium phoceense]
MDVEKRTMGASMSTGTYVEPDCTFDVTLHRSNPNTTRVWAEGAPVYGDGGRIVGIIVGSADNGGDSAVTPLGRLG